MQTALITGQEQYPSHKSPSLPVYAVEAVLFEGEIFEIGGWERSIVH